MVESVAGEGCVDAAEWAAGGDDVVEDDFDWSAEFAGGFGDDLEEGAMAEEEAGFVPAHAGALAAGEDEGDEWFLFRFPLHAGING